MLKPFGSILKGALPVTVTTADGIEKHIPAGIVTRIGLTILGLPHMGLRMRARTILRLLPFSQNALFLDAGCGIGLYCFSLAGRYKSVWGIDNDRVKIERAQDIAKALGISNLDFKVADLRQLPFNDNTFDAILCTEVIEHIDDDCRALSELSRVLKPAGRLILTTTATTGISRQHQQDFHHARAGYQPEALALLCERSGLHVVGMRPYGLFFGRLAWRLNRISFGFNPLAALAFYPLFIVSFLDSTIGWLRQRNCIGYIVELGKNIVYTEKV